jgi:pyruvate/2-oxoglutarate dehydrogenase complex dihydrolipoamide dehydrogenase (E3) component/glutaredoxin
VSRENGEIVAEARVGAEPRRFRAERILCATGRHPITAGMGLEEAGIRLGKDGRIIVDDCLQSSAAGVYGAGDVIGEPTFVYTAAYEGRLAAENALNGNSRQRDYSALPWVIFTDPQVAGVGLNEKEASTARIEIQVSRLDLEHVPRALAARDTRGFIKLIKERCGDKLLGTRLLAPEGGEQIEGRSQALVLFRVMREESNMATKRKIEVFSAGCPACEETVQLVKRIACSSCEVSVLDMNEPTVAKRAKSLGVRSVPAVVIDGKLADCCAGRGPREPTLRAAGVAQAI